MAAKAQNGRLRSPLALAVRMRSSTLVQGGLPCLLGQGQDRGLDALVAVEPDREPQLAAGQFVDEGMGGAGGIGPHQGRPAPHWLGQPKQRHPQHGQMIGCGVGAGVAGPQDGSQRLAGAIAAVQPAAQRVEPEALLVGRRRALLVGVRVDQGRVNVQDQRPCRGRAQRPGLLANPGQR